jgi:RNA polymerase sigma factor (sigma-70 family)
VHSLAHIDIAHDRETDLQRSLAAKSAKTAGVTEAPRTLEPVTRDPFIDDLDDATPADTTSTDIPSVRATARSELRERQRARVLASLHAVAGPAKPSDRRWANPAIAGGLSRPRRAPADHSREFCMPNTSPNAVILRALPGQETPYRSPDRERELTALVDAARAGDNAAWARLVERFDRMLRDIARSYGLAPTEIDDVIQAIRLRLFMHIDHLREPAAVAGWLATTTRRESLRRRQSAVREQLSDDPRLGDDADRDGPEATLLAAERLTILARALGTLPDRHRRLMTLLAAESTPDYRQVSAILAMPTGSIGPIRGPCLARLARN